MNTVWVVWDPLYEKVTSVHKSEAGADKKCERLNKEPERINYHYPYENSEFILEE